jgi:hypothetical protein
VPQGRDHEGNVLILGFSSFDCSRWSLYLDREGYASQEYLCGRRKVCCCCSILIFATLMISSIWVFLLLGSEAIKTYKSHPNFRYDHSSRNRKAATNNTQSRPLQNPHLDFASVRLCRCVDPGVQCELPWSSLCHSCRLST